MLNHITPLPLPLLTSTPVAVSPIQLSVEKVVARKCLGGENPSFFEEMYDSEQPKTTTTITTATSSSKSTASYSSRTKRVLAPARKRIYLQKKQGVQKKIRWGRNGMGKGKREGRRDMRGSGSIFNGCNRERNKDNTSIEVELILDGCTEEPHFSAGRMSATSPPHKTASGLEHEAANQGNINNSQSNSLQDKGTRLHRDEVTCQDDKGISQSDKDSCPSDCLVHEGTSDGNGFQRDLGTGQSYGGHMQGGRNNAEGHERNGRRRYSCQAELETQTRGQKLSTATVNKNLSAPCKIPCSVPEETEKNKALNTCVDKKRKKKEVAKVKA